MYQRGFFRIPWAKGNRVKSFRDLRFVRIARAQTANNLAEPPLATSVMRSSTFLGGPTGGASKKGTVIILTVKMEWWKPMIVGSAPLGCNANPLTGYILASFGPCIGRQKN